MPDGSKEQKEVEGLRRLAELLREAHAAVQEGPAPGKQAPKSKKLGHRDPKPARNARGDAPRRPKP